MPPDSIMQKADIKKIDMYFKRDSASNKWCFKTTEDMIASGLGSKAKTRTMSYNINSLDDIKTKILHLESVRYF